MAHPRNTTNGFPCIECRRELCTAGFALCYDCWSGDRSRQWKVY